MKKYLILIMTCKKNTSIQNKIENTILRTIPNNISVLFVEGGYEENKIVGNKLQLNVQDDYKNFIYKVQNAYKYVTLMKDWDYLIKADDDVYLMLENISNFIPPEGYDYYGMLNDATLNGMFYILPRKTVEFLSNVEITGGNILGEAWGGLKLHCPESEWNNVIPEDSYFTAKMLNNNMKGYSIKDNIEFVKYISRNIKETNVEGLHPEIFQRRGSLLAFFDVEEYEFEMYYKRFNNESKIKSDYIVMVCSCRKNKDKLERIRKSWALNIPNNVKVIYLIGGYEQTRLNGDILETKVKDDYKNFINKVQDGYRFLRDNAEFKYLIKCDDDVYVNLNIVSTFNYKEYDVIGRIWDGIHMCGPLYVLNKLVVDYLANHTIDQNWVNKNVWEGLFVHCPNKNEWKDVIPEDYYFSEVLNKTKFKRDHNPKAINLIKYGKEENKTSIETLSNSIGFFDIQKEEFQYYKNQIDKYNKSQNIAFAIIAHHDIENVNNLIYQIKQNSKHHIFVYVDKKCQENIKSIMPHSNVHIIKKTKSIYWGDFSFVQAQLRLIKDIKDFETKNPQIHFNYISFHSGNDILLENINEYSEYLNSFDDTNQIDCNFLPCKELMYGGEWRYKYKWPVDLIRKDEHLFEEYGRNKIMEMMSLPPNNIIDIPIFYGQRWFVLTSNTAKYCLDYSIKNKKIMKSFLKTYLPAESYFQSIIMNSDLNNFSSNLKMEHKVKSYVPTMSIKNLRTEFISLKNIPNIKERVYIGRKMSTKHESYLITKMMYKTVENNYMPVHFIWMDKNGTGFKFWHYIALKSFIKNNSNKRIIIHTNAKLNESWWTELNDDIEFRFIPEKYIKKDLKFFSHNIDYYRYKVLYEEGGCYIDFDTVTTGNIDNIVDSERLVFSSCYENNYEFSGGFFITPKPWHPLLKDILDIYHKDYRPDNWNYNATIIPGELAKRKYMTITRFIFDRDILFPIPWENNKDIMKYEDRDKLMYKIITAKRSVSVHFYNAAYNKMLEETTFDNYKTNKTIYALLCRITLDNNWNEV